MGNVPECPTGKKVDTHTEQPPTVGGTDVSRSGAASQCDSCVLQVPADASTSTVTLTRLTNKPYSSLSKVFIKPSLPFKLSFNDPNPDAPKGTMRDYTIDTMAVYYPSPIRIENVQHDAVLSLGDPSVGSDLVVLIPLAVSNTANVGTSFLDRITPFIRATLGAQAQLNTIAVDQTQGSQPIEPSANSARCGGDEAGPKTLAAIQKRINEMTAERARLDAESGIYGPAALEWYGAMGYTEADLRNFDYACATAGSGGSGLPGFGKFGGASRCDIIGAWGRSDVYKEVRIPIDALDRNIQAMKDQLEQTKKKTDDMYVSQIEDKIRADILKTQLTSCNDTSVQVGSDWKLTKLIPIEDSYKPGEPGSVAQGPYYQWKYAKYKERVVSDTKCERKFKWEEDKNSPSRQYILFTDPALISPAAMTSIRTLPYTDPTKAIDGVMSYVYKKGPCRGCRPALPGGPEYLKQMQNIENSHGIAKEDLFKIAIGIFGAILIAAGIYMAIMWTFKDTAAQLPTIGDTLGLVIKKTIDGIISGISSFFSSLFGSGGGGQAQPAGQGMPDLQQLIPKGKNLSSVAKLFKK